MALGITPIGVVESWLEKPMYRYLRNTLSDVEYVGLETQPNLEKIAWLNPDLIVGTRFRHERVSPLLEKRRQPSWQALYLISKRAFHSSPRPPGGKIVPKDCWRNGINAWRIFAIECGARALLGLMKPPWCASKVTTYVFILRGLPVQF